MRPQMPNRARHLQPLSPLFPSCLSAGVRTRQQGFPVTLQKRSSEERPQKKILRRKASKEKASKEKPQTNNNKKPQKKRPQKKRLQKKNLKRITTKSLKRKGLIRKAEENEICQENLLDNHIDAE